MNQINASTIRYYLKQYSSLLIICIALPLLLIFVLFSYFNYQQKEQDIAQLQTEVDANQKKVDTLKREKALVGDNVDSYNQILTQLIPESEDYFSIIYALEQISQKTNFIIDKYSVNLEKSTSNKISILVTGSGDSKTFLEFLKNYQYIGGRLITNEKMEFTPSGVNQIQLSLNFYNKKSDSSDTTSQPVTQKDVALMNEIKSKTSLIIKQDSTAVDYPTKSNPF